MLVYQRVTICLSIVFFYAVLVIFTATDGGKTSTISSFHVLWLLPIVGFMSESYVQGCPPSYNLVYKPP